MKAAVITIAGTSSRFNEGVPEGEKRHKAIYHEGAMENTLLYHLLEKCLFADKVILVGGNAYRDVEGYCAGLPAGMRDRLVLVYNEHYADLASGYSLYIGLKELFGRHADVDEVLFVEGDLDIDAGSFARVVRSGKDVLTYSYGPVHASRAVVLYKDAGGHYKYVFNSSHGLLEIREPFSLLLNSGQLWKFTDMEKLERACDRFFGRDKRETNLGIIQDYIGLCGDGRFELAGLRRWTNCNTREDYKKILSYWEAGLK